MLAIGNLFLALTLAQAAPAAEPPGRVSGRVTVEGAGTPLAGVRVMLMPTAPPTSPRGLPPQALTDQDGRYIFDRIAAGTYRVTAEKSGYAPLADMNRAPTLAVTAGQPVTFDLHLRKGAVIAGRILDARGEPVTDARIIVLRRMTPPAGAPAFRNMPRLIPAGGQSQQTNDLGEYRVAGLAPGEYFVAAAPRPVGMFGGPGAPAMSPPSTGRSARTTVATTYYPGTTDQAAAQPIAVAAGAEVGNISFAVQSLPAFRVSGVVVDEDGHPVAGAMVSLTGDPRNGAMFMGPAGMTRTQDDGRFAIDDAVPGTYRAHASILVSYPSGGATAGLTGGASGGAIVSRNSGSSVTWSSNDSSAATMDQPIEVVVTDADVSGLRIVARRPAPR
jgi:protocatechuate 3,4-dioxygenase beta subunit